MQAHRHLAAQYSGADVSAVVVSLKAERLNRGLSLRKMAKEVGVAAGTLARAEEGDRVHPGSALKIAKFLGLQVTP